MSSDSAPVDPIAAALLLWLDEHAAGGVLTTDTALVVRSWNRWLSTVTGLPAADVIGRPLFELVPSLAERGFDTYFHEALAGQIKMLSHTLHRHILPCQRPGGELMPQSGRIAPLVNGDPGRLGQVVLNLIQNAIHALTASGRTGTVRVSVAAVTGGVELVVEDDGPGIPDYVLPRIFEPFFTTKRHGEGTGLGLAVTAEIVTRHGGTIDVDTSTAGTRFRVLLPAAEPAA